MPEPAASPDASSSERMRSVHAPELPRLVEERVLLPSESVLCYGCGRGVDVAWLKTRKFRAHGFDPYPPFGYSAEPTGTFDVVLLVYLLTRLKTDENRRAVLGKAFRHVRPGGRMVILTRNWRRLAGLAGMTDRESGITYVQNLLQDCDIFDWQIVDFGEPQGVLGLAARRPGGHEPRNAITWVETPEAIDAACAAFSREPRIGLDVETTLEEPRELCTIQLGGVNQTYIIDAQVVSDWSPIRAILENERVEKVIHNAQFETEMFAKKGIRIRNVFDTLPASRKKHRRGVDGGHKLGEVCARELGIYLDKSLQTSDWTTRPLSPAQIKYAALDAEVLLDLYRVFNPPKPHETLSLFPGDA